MGELGWNKIFFSVIAAGLIILGLKEVSSIAFPSGYGHGHGHEDDHGDVNAKYAKEFAYFIPVETGPSVEVEEAPFDLGAALASADASAGERVMRAKCSSCHNWNEGEGNKTGPLLYDVFGHPVGGRGDFNYSATFQAKEGPWTYEKLNTFLTNPSAWAEGTSMTFAGLRRDGERADVIAFLASMSPSAPDFPAPAAEAAGEAIEDAAATIVEDPPATQTDVTDAVTGLEADVNGAGETAQDAAEGAMDDLTGAAEDLADDVEAAVDEVEEAADGTEDQ